MISSLQQLKDCCLIIVGDGGDADEVLAKRRLEAGGRLCHILTRGSGDPRVKVQAFPNDGGFYWQPPDAFYKMSPLGSRLGGVTTQSWTKTGMDAIVLPDDHELVVAKIEEGLQHIHILDAKAEVMIEMSGCVVLHPDMETATNEAVDVHNMHLKPAGTFSARGVSLGCLVSYVELLALYLLMMFFETSLQDEAPWWRNVFFYLISVPTAGPPIVRVLAFALCGHDLQQLQAYAICFLGLVVATIASVSTGWRLSEVSCAFMGYSGFCCGLGGVYYCGRHQHPLRKFWTRLAWLMAFFVSTAGCMSVVAVSIIMYGWMIGAKQAGLAALFLPTMTAGAEISFVKFAQVAHSKLVCMRQSEDMTSGDQLFIVVPYMIMNAHASCEVARLMAMFIGAVRNGDFSWVSSAAATFFFNLLMRSGWTSFFMFHLCKLFCGRRFAAKRFAPGAFNKLHNHCKVLGGYLRFVPLISLVTARGLMYGFAGDQIHPTFNTSAGMVLLVMFVLELLEDVAVLSELIPVSPIPTDWLKVVSGNADPHQLYAMELRPCRPCGPSDPSDLGNLGHLKISKISAVVPTDASDSSDLLEWRPALGPMDRTLGGRIRRWTGQPRPLRPALALHGLREMPLSFQFAFTFAVVAAVALPLLPTMLGAGYMLGLNAPCPSSEVFIQYFWQESPYSC